MKPHFQSVTVTAPARLHMGFIDLSGALGRNFGSIGVAINEIYTQVRIQASDQLLVTGVSSDRAKSCVQKLCKVLQVPDRLQIEIVSAIPEHIGLGSGTQMALAIGAAINAFYGLGLPIREIARLSDRGMRSGIGIGVFEQGGLVVDGGRGHRTVTPPLLSRMAVPQDWRFLLVFDKRGQGLHGEQELSAFKQLPPFPRQQAERLCYLLLMQGLPALAEADITDFGAVITQLQTAVGEHFAPVQGGIFTSVEVAAAMHWLEQQGAVAIGQTSWGPTGFCAIDSPERAQQLLASVNEVFSDSPNLSVQIVSPCNRGASIIHQ